MRRSHWPICLLLLAVGCASDDVVGPAPATVIEAAHLASVDLSPGIRVVTVGSADAPLRLCLSVPAPAPAADAPLVLALHWAGSDIDNLAEQYLRALAEPGLRERGAVIVAPTASGSDWTGPAAARTLASLVEAATAVWPVDPQRVVVTGYSMGGDGTWYLVSVHPELFSAAIPMACEPSAVLTPQVPLLAIQGDEDERYPIEYTQAAVATLQSLGGIADLLVASGLTHGEVLAYRPYLAQAVSWLADTVWSAD